jgi:hypothetical protein
LQGEIVKQPFQLAARGATQRAVDRMVCSGDLEGLQRTRVDHRVNE